MDERNPCTKRNTPPSSPSFKQKLKLKYISCLPSALRKSILNNKAASLPASPVLDSDNDSNSSTPRNSCVTKSSPNSLDKCKSFITRIGRNAQGLAHGHVQNNGNGNGSGSVHGRGHRRRHSVSADFRYDAESYALNFDEGNDDSIENKNRLRTFSSRLPQSPKKDIDYT